MQRVGILINKLQEQLQQGSDVHKMLVTTQMLYTELLQEKETLNGNYTSSVAITSPNNTPVAPAKVVEAFAAAVAEDKKEWIQEITPIEVKGQTKEQPTQVEE